MGGAEPLSAPQTPGPPLEAVLEMAFQGDGKAQMTLAVLYENRQAYADAFRWFQRAADQGMAEARFKVGFYYLAGQGLSRDPARAAEWFLKAAEQGYSPAQYNLGLCHEKGLGVPASFTEAGKWYLQAAGQGNPAAQKALGVLHELGRGVETDYGQAYRWYETAAAQGFSDARALSRNLQQKMTPEQLDRGRELLAESLRQPGAEPNVAAQMPKAISPAKKTVDFLD